MRLLREILEDTLEEADGRAAVACRITVDELLGDQGITREDIEEVIGELGELPDLWDFVLGSWEDDSVTARFGDEAAQEAHVRGLKALTSKPVVGVGRFTSPDTMVHMVRSGVLDMIGAARPSIADPFLPRKIEEGRFEDIRECIGCNICVAGDFTMSPIRCTQNPTMGEEWRRGWHPERIRPRTSDAKVLVVGGGPAGLEAAQSLGKRGYEVILADRSRPTRRPGRARGAAARDGQLRPRRRLSPRPAAPAAQRRAGRGRGHRGGDPRLRLRPRRGRDRSALARRWRRALPHPADRARSGAARAHAGRPDGGHAARVRPRRRLRR